MRDLLLAGCFCLVLFLAGLASAAPPPDKPQDQRTAAETFKTLGSVKLGEFQGSVLFQYPEDDGKSYRIDVAISKPWSAPQIKSDRIQAWLLARGGKFVTLKQKPPAGSILIEVGSAGATASAMFLFDHTVNRQELVGVVVSLDGELKTFKIPPVAKKKP